MSGFLDLDLVWLAAVGVLAALGLWLLLSGLVRTFRGRLLRGPLRGAIGIALGAVAVALAAVGMNLHTYNRLDYEQPVAWLEFQQAGPQRYQALLRTADGTERAFGVYGDEWQLDARVLKWKGVGALLGLDPRYRLERFSGRYATAADERHAVRSIYGLAAADAGIDVWQLSREVEQFLPLVDTVYGSAAYMPMEDGARFAVVITEDGLVARRVQSTTKSQ